MAIDKVKELEVLLPEYMKVLEEQGLTEERDNGFWNCLYCNSGRGDNSTPAFHIVGNRFHCFSCGAKGNIFDLVAHMNNLQDKWSVKYFRTLAIMRPYLDMKKAAISDDKVTPKLGEADCREYLLQCHANVSRTDYFHRRGLSDQTIARFKLGYDPKKNLVIIPYDAELTGYIHRILWNGNNKYCKHGSGAIFNQAALQEHDAVFVTEGQIDAMSFEELGFPAIGLGGTNEYDKLVHLLQKIENKKILILALDNDIPGRKATAKLILVLAEAEIVCELVWDTELYGKYKDANECLVNDPKGFTERVRKRSY